MAVVGVNVDHDDLVKFAKGLSSTAGSSSGEVKLGGGEIRTENGSNVAHVAVVGAGAA